MSIPSPGLTAYRFGPFRLDVRDRLLEKNEERIALTPKVLDTLFVLVEKRGQVVSKEELIKSVWPDVAVVESGLTRNLSVLRKALADQESEGAYIETIPKRGYRFVATVVEERGTAAEPAQTSPGERVAARDGKSPRDSRLGVWGVVALGAVMAAVLLSIATTTKPRPAPVEPLVRIGEHFLYKLSPEAMERAVGHFEQAIAANPRSSGAHAGLAIALLGLVDFGARLNKDSGQVAMAAARKAVALDAASCPAHSALAAALLIHEWRFRAADEEFRRALEVDPRSVQARLLYARLKIATGKPAEARQLVEEALQLDPASPALGTEYCRAYYYLRDFERAEAECRKVLDRERGFALAHYYLALCSGALRRFGEARKSLRDSGFRPGVVEADEAWLSLLEGDPKPAEAVLESRRSLIRAGRVDAAAKLLPATMLGRMDEVYEALEAALANRSPEMLTVAVEPRLDAIRKDPRYRGVLRRLER